MPRGSVRTFLGARRDDEDPWDERMEEGSSAMMGEEGGAGMQQLQQSGWPSDEA